MHSNLKFLNLQNEHIHEPITNFQPGNSLDQKHDAPLPWIGGIFSVAKHINCKITRILTAHLPTSFFPVQ